MAHAAAVIAQHQRRGWHADLRRANEGDMPGAAQGGVTTDALLPAAREEVRMAQRIQGDLIVWPDITAKVMAVAEVQVDGELRIAGLASRPSHGPKRGVVVNIERPCRWWQAGWWWQSIQQALKDSRDDGRLQPEITRLHWHHRQPHPRPELHPGTVIAMSASAIDVARVWSRDRHAITIP